MKKHCLSFKKDTRNTRHIYQKSKKEKVYSALDWVICGDKFNLLGLIKLNQMIGML